MSLRILSIDGGGIRGVIAARILVDIEQRLGQPLRDYFDLIAGTSTGALIAAGLMVGRSAVDLMQLYLNQGQIIFPYQTYWNPQRLKLLVQYGLSAPKFSDQGLTRVIQAELGLSQTLADVSPQGINDKKLMVTSYDTVRRTPVIFKSWRHEEWYASVPLWEVCVCSASAPTYFPAHLLLAELAGQPTSFSMIDGGVGANNPTACAVAEAIRLMRTGAVPGQGPEASLDRIVDDISVLSVGTGELNKSLPWREVRAWGLLQWAPRIVDVVMDAPADIHRYIAEQIVTKADSAQTECYLRLQPELEQKFGAIDNANPAYLAQLVAIAENYLRTQSHQINAFLSC